MIASVGSEPGPTPSMNRPRVMWSSCTARSATMYGLWYATLITPVPSLMCRVRSAAAAMKISGEAMISVPAEWCSPIQASSHPSLSRWATSSRSRSMASVGFSPAWWNGAMKMPKRRRSVIATPRSSTPARSL